jgi:DNA-directed RNA polymerase subunit alpha
MQSDEMAEKLEMSTAEIGLSVRTTNCLEEKGIFTVHDLLNCTRADLLSISNFGEKTLEEVYKASTRPAAREGGCRSRPPGRHTGGFGLAPGVRLTMRGRRQPEWRGGES